MGEAVAVKLGLELSRRDGAPLELFHQGLGRARNTFERKKVIKAIGEWADGDSVAAHYGFGIELSCSDDFGKGGSNPSVLDPNNRGWLTPQFGMQFVTLAELA